MQSAFIVPQAWLVEGLILVVLQSVQSADLVSVRVLFGLPGSAVPVLAVAGVAGCELVTCHLGELHDLGVIKLHGCITGSPVGLGEGFWAEVAVTEGCGAVVNWLMV